MFGIIDLSDAIATVEQGFASFEVGYAVDVAIADGPERDRQGYCWGMDKCGED